jgi:hypothetical protein
VGTLDGMKMNGGKRDGCADEMNGRNIVIIILFNSFKFNRPPPAIYPIEKDGQKG